MGKQGYDNSRELAEAIGYPHSRIRNGIGGSDVVGWKTVYAIARALKSPGETVDAVVLDIVATGDGVPDSPPEQPKPTKAPARRTETEKTTRPKRAQDRERAA